MQMLRNAEIIGRTSPRILLDEADVRRAASVGIAARRVHRYDPLIGHLLSRKEVEQRALSRTVMSYDHDELTARDFELDLVQRRDAAARAAKSLGYGVQANGCHLSLPTIAGCLATKLWGKVYPSDRAVARLATSELPTKAIRCASPAGLPLLST